MCPEESGTSARRQAEGPTSARQKPQKVAHFWTGPAASLGSRRLTHSLTARPQPALPAPLPHISCLFAGGSGKSAARNSEKLRENRRKIVNFRIQKNSSMPFLWTVWLLGVCGCFRTEVLENVLLE